ncbi:hypothetical protein PT274_03510 [Leuconostocaceae bacterium ESL0958]|nr:hypothetical protein [Leuconostocaceae bacterium ESL0958]
MMNEQQVKNLQDELLVFELSEGWYLGPQGVTQLVSPSPQGSLDLIDRQFEGYYREADWTFERVRIVANPLAAAQFDSVDDSYAKHILMNFPSGHFRKVILQGTICPVE